MALNLVLALTGTPARTLTLNFDLCQTVSIKVHLMKPSHRLSVQWQ